MLYNGFVSHSDQIINPARKAVIRRWIYNSAGSESSTLESFTWRINEWEYTDVVRRALYRTTPRSEGQELSHSFVLRKDKDPWDSVSGHTRVSQSLSLSFRGLWAGGSVTFIFCCYTFFTFFFSRTRESTNNQVRRGGWVSVAWEIANLSLWFAFLWGADHRLL